MTLHIWIGNAGGWLEKYAKVAHSDEYIVLENTWSIDDALVVTAEEAAILTSKLVAKNGKHRILVVEVKEEK